MHHGTLADALVSTAEMAARECDTYHECSLARKLGFKLRLVGLLPDVPVYQTPRIVRYAAFTGMGLLELDAPASHSRQILKYARRFKLPSATLEDAYGSVEKIYKFRSSIEGIVPAQVKKISNLLGYGNAGKEWMKLNGLAKMPGKLQNLKEEIQGVIDHIAKHRSQEEWEAVKDRPRWKLTLLSVHCQLGERRELDTAVARLPSDTVNHGWLGDSILIAPGPSFNAQAFLDELAAEDIILTVKPLPTNEEQYYEMYRDVVGADFDRSILSGRSLRQAQAKAYAQRFLKDPGSMRYVPHLEFAISVESLLPMVYNPDTKQTEFFSASHGRWFDGGGQDQARGETLSDALIKTFVPTKWGYVEKDDARLSLSRVKEDWDDSAFRSSTFLGPVGEAVKSLRFARGTNLDMDPRFAKVINFEGPYHLDFACPETDFDWESDDQLEAAIYMPLQETTKDLRVSRFVPREFEKYGNPGRFRAVRALRKAMLELRTADVLSIDVRQDLAITFKENPMLQKVFYEPHKDYNSAVFQSRLVFEPVAFKGPRTQVASLMDSGDGGTGKGTLRDLCEECLAPNNGGTQRGYAAVLKQETLQVKKTEGPSEQISNTFQCRHAWVDDFAPTVPLSTAVLRQLSGGNNITAARKHGKEVAFKFSGQLMLACNGAWRGDEPFKGADVRRMTGLNFEVQFVDVVTGQNQMLKDSSIKREIRTYFSAFWFFALAFRILPQPRDASDYTEPKPPNTLELIKILQHKQDEDEGATVEDAKAFILEKMHEYTLSQTKPTSMNEIDAAFVKWVWEKKNISVEMKDVRKLLCTRFFAKTGWSLKAHGARKKTTVNVYLDGGEDGEPWVLK